MVMMMQWRYGEWRKGPNSAAVITALFLLFRPYFVRFCCFSIAIVRVSPSRCVYYHLFYTQQHKKSSRHHIERRFECAELLLMTTMAKRRVFLLFSLRLTTTSQLVMMLNCVFVFGRDRPTRGRRISWWNVCLWLRLLRPQMEMKLFHQKGQQWRRRRRKMLALSQSGKMRWWRNGEFIFGIVCWIFHSIERMGLAEGGIL